MGVQIGPRTEVTKDRHDQGPKLIYTVGKTGIGNLRHKQGETSVHAYSSAVRSKLSFEHFVTSAVVSGQFGPTKPVPKCVVPNNSHATHSCSFRSISISDILLTVARCWPLNSWNFDNICSLLRGLDFAAFPEVLAFGPSPLSAMFLFVYQCFHSLFCKIPRSCYLKYQDSVKKFRINYKHKIYETMIEIQKILPLSLSSALDFRPNRLSANHFCYLRIKSSASNAKQ